MGALVTLASKALEVVPGSVASCTVTVKNTGTVVDQFTNDVLGDPGAFASAEPPALSLVPGAEGTAVVSFVPPRDAATPAGALVPTLAIGLLFVVGPTSATPSEVAIFVLRAA